MIIEPIGKRVVLRQVEAEEKTKSGIILTGTVREKPQYAEVIAIGSDISPEILKGDKVIYKQYAGTTVKIENEEYILIDEEDILAVITDKE